MRVMGAPMMDVLMLVSPSGVLGGLLEGANEGAFGELDFEAVVLQRFCVGHGGVGGATEIFCAGGLAFEDFFGFTGAPGFGSYATEGDAHALHASAAHVDDDGGGREG